MNPTRRRSDSGVALFSVLVLALVLIGLSMPYLATSMRGVQSADFELDLSRARHAADEGLSRAMAELREGVDAGGDGLGALTFTGVDERVIQVTAEDLLLESVVH